LFVKGDTVEDNTLPTVAYVYGPPEALLKPTAYPPTAQPTEALAFVQVNET